MYARHDYEVPGAAAYDYVAARPEVDAEKVIVMGYSFGGYYDTFGGYGGQYAYGYRRYNGNYSSTTSLFSIPLYGPSESSDTCGWLRQRAKTTGARNWRARYEACRRGN